MKTLVMGDIVQLHSVTISVKENYRKYLKTLIMGDIVQQEAIQKKLMAAAVSLRQQPVCFLAQKIFVNIYLFVNIFVNIFVYLFAGIVFDI